MLLLLLLAGGGFMVYQHSQKATNLPVAPVPQPGAAQTTQPSQAYPVKAVQSARVDNTTQPWYGGSNLFNMVTSTKPAGLATAANPNSSSTATGLNVATQSANLWNTLDANSWFTSASDDPADVNSADSTETYGSVDYSGTSDDEQEFADSDSWS